MTIYPEIRITKSDILDWQVTEDCLLIKYNITIKKGFITDLVSSTRLFWFIIPPHGLSSNASIVHDYIWRNSIFSRKQCDKIFLELLIESVPKWQAYIMYIVVRAFGWMKKNKL
jgi:hypothetical protein